MDLSSFLTRGALGEIRLTGTRIDLMHVIDLSREGRTAEQIAEQFDLAAGLIRQVLAFSEDNRAAVDAYVAACHEEMDRRYAAHRPAPSTPRLALLRRLLAEAEKEHAGDPEWAGLSLGEKLRRMEALAGPEAV
jgi:uncharacterized protein (DUF433 family)